MAGVIHWLFPSRRHVAIGLAAELGLVGLGLPLWIHLTLGVLLHLAVPLVAPRPRPFVGR